MTDVMPTVIAEYLGSSDSHDLEETIACFTEDAVVLDEDKGWRGRSSIREWREGVASAFQYTVDILDVQGRGTSDGLERWHVFLHLEGNFPGGKVDLTSRFALRDGLIAKLEIVLTGADRS